MNPSPSRTPGRALVAQAVVLLGAIDLTLRWSSLGMGLALARRLARMTPPNRARSLDEISDAVHRGARVVPWAPCLPRSLAAHVLARWSGHPSQVLVGVAKDGRPENISAHAWTESGDRTIVGESERTYSSFAPLDL